MWFGAVAAANSQALALASGTNLHCELKTSCRRIIWNFKEYQQDQLADVWIAPTYQVILNLTTTFDDWAGAMPLTGGAMNQENIWLLVNHR
jgi:hypothetical protein